MISLRRLLPLCLPLLLSACAQDDIEATRTPSVQLNPERLVFPKIAVDATEEQVIEVRNTGTGTLRIAEIAASLSRDADYEIFYRHDAAADWRVAFTALGRRLAPPVLQVPGGTSLYLSVTVTPRAPILADGALTLTSNLGPIVIPIEHTDADPELYVDPTSVDFGRVPAGASGMATVEITNLGQAALRLDDIAINGSQDFTPSLAGRDPRRAREVLDDPDGDGEPGLAPGGTIELTIRYAPLTEGPDRAELTIHSNDPLRPTLTIPLTANAAAPCLDASPAALEFPASLVNRTDSRPLELVSCGGGAIVIDDVSLGADSDPAFALAGVPETPFELPGLDPEGPPATSTLRVQFTPQSERVHEGRVVVLSNDPLVPSRAIQLLGRGVQNACPVAGTTRDHFQVRPLDIVELDGSPSLDPDGPNGAPVQYDWVVVRRPDGSNVQPVDGFFNPAQPGGGGFEQDRTTPTALLFAELVGTYVLELRVRDALGLSSVECETSTQVVVDVIPDQAIHVQLTWETEGDPDTEDGEGTDLDLHLLHPNAVDWFSAPFDCYYRNPVPDWGQLENPADDPSLDIDDVDGGGPENITLDQPEDTAALGAPYIVGVHAYRLRGRLTDRDFGATRPTVRIYVRGVLAWDSSAELAPLDLDVTGQFWDVAAIEWPSGRVIPRNRLMQP